MSRDVPYDEEAICDICGRKGAYDFTGDYFCDDCLKKDEVNWHEVKTLTERSSYHLKGGE